MITALYPIFTLTAWIIYKDETIVPLIACLLLINRKPTSKEILLWIAIVLMFIFMLFRGFDWSHLKFVMLLMLLSNSKTSRGKEKYNIAFYGQCVFLIEILLYRNATGVWPFKNPATIAMILLFLISDNLLERIKDKWQFFVLSVFEAAIVIMVGKPIFYICLALILLEFGEIVHSTSATRKAIQLVQIITILISWILLWREININEFDVATWIIGGKILSTTNDIVFILGGYGLVGMFLFISFLIKFSSARWLLLVTLAFFIGLFANYACVPMIILIKKSVYEHKNRIGSLVKLKATLPEFLSS